MILPSNVKSLTEKRNKTGHYTTYLPKILTIDKKKWKVAVIDISYVVSWFNITMENCAIVITKEGSTDFRRHIPLNHYQDTASLVQAIDELLQQSPGNSRMKLQDNKPVLWVASGVSVIFHEITAAMLGFNGFHYKNEYEKSFVPFVATNRANVHLPLQNIYIYSNIVEHIAVGDTYAPLLQVVPVQKNVYGSVQHHQFLNPLYMSLSTDELSVIEVKLCDDRGNEIDFAVGNVVIKLKFRKEK